MKLAPISTDNIQDLRKLREFEEPILTAIALSPDNRHLACATLNKRVVHRDYIGRKTVHEFTVSNEDAQVFYLEYTSGGGQLVAMADGLWVWRIKPPALVMKQAGNLYESQFVHFRLVGSKTDEVLYVTTYLDQVVEVVDTSKWRVVDQFKGCKEVLGYHALAPDARRMAIIDHAKFQSDSKGCLAVWSLERSAIEWKYVPDSVRDIFPGSVCFHPTRSLLAVGERGHVSVWSLPDGQQVADLRFERDSIVENLSFSPDGRLLAVGSTHFTVEHTWGGTDVDETYRCTLWDWEWGAQLFSIPDVGRYLTFSRDGSRLLVANDKAMQLWGIRVPGKKSAKSK